MFIKKVLFRAEREAGTGLRAVATLVIEAQIELIAAADIRIPGIRIYQGFEGRSVEFPRGFKFLSDQYRAFIEQEVLFRHSRWLERCEERRGGQADTLAA